MATDYTIPKEEYRGLLARLERLEAENAGLRELLSTALGQVREMCESNKDRCAACPLHHGHDECRMVMARSDARELGVEVNA